MSNLREYQIRITDDFGEEEVFNCHDTAEPRIAQFWILGRLMRRLRVYGPS